MTARDGVSVELVPICATLESCRFSGNGCCGNCNASKALVIYLSDDRRLELCKAFSGVCSILDCRTVWLKDLESPSRCIFEPCCRALEDRKSRSTKKQELSLGMLVSSEFILSSKHNFVYDIRSTYQA